jgi:hypothetical protein
VQVREESKWRNSDKTATTYTLAEGIKRNYWINCDYVVHPKLKMKTRAQFSTYTFNGNRSQGMAMMQDLSLDLGKVGLTGRYVLFATDDYDNRHYVYERDVWLAYSLPAYNGSGVRSFLLLEYKINKHLGLWIRYARTRTTEENKETAMDAENTRNDIKFQLRLSF